MTVASSENRTVFTVTGAFLGRIDGETRCAFWADDPSLHGFAPARLIAIDLARTPSAAAAGLIVPVRRAACPPPRRRAPAVPPDGGAGQAHEFTAAVYPPGTADPRAGRRYLGHHAEAVRGVPPWPRHPGSSRTPA